LKTLTRKKGKGTELDVFSDRAGRANSAIFDILLKESPQTIKRILKLITNYDGLEETYYASLTKRLHALQQEEYTKEVKESPKGQSSYELRIKAYLSMVLRENSMQDIIDKATDTQRAFILLALLNVLLSEKDSGSQPSGKGNVES
jgi:hypothetical protein